MIAVIATIRVQDDKAAEFEAAVRELETLVNAEPGCRMYKMTRSRTEPNTYKNIELFVDQVAIDSHVASEHFQTLVPRMSALVGGESHVDFLDTID